MRTAEFAVLEAHRAHAQTARAARSAAIAFAVRLRAPEGGGALAAALAPRLTAIACRGVPNYFGPQRFGREGGNLARLSRQHGAARPAAAGATALRSRRRAALIFNAVLAERVAAGSWEQLGR